MSDFFTTAVLATAAGTISFVTTMVEITKFLIKANINPRWYCLGWAFVAMVAHALWLNPAVSAADWFTAFINVFLVAAAATGAYEHVVKPLERKVLETRESEKQIDSTSDEGLDHGE